MTTLPSVLAIALSLTTLTATAQERRLDRASLPAAVAATIDRETHGATIKGYSTERENGRTVYEAETVIDGRTRDLQISKSGKLNEVEEEVDLDSLDPAVQSAIRARAHGATITKVESLTKQGKLVAYEASTQKGAHNGEVQVGPHGETLQHAE